MPAIRFRFSPPIQGALEPEKEIIKVVGGFVSGSDEVR